MNIPAIPGLAGSARRVLARLRHGRPVVLAARVLAGLALAAITLHTGAGPAPQIGVLAGIATWLVLTCRRDIAPPPGR